ncbi:hypothetical protein NE237_017680 [Protea cynaroides]|uniref:PGG domain-containing protein n=1 Tax=Protea cynaroides TaxID=273540 RepID=A0A9Q0K8G1_9MAGN|nr:hypothetical protein NE237_017680 [Protea cynaroides]
MDLELIKVVREGDINGLKKLQEKDPSILHQVTPMGNTLLHLAAKFGNLNFLVEVCDRCPSLITQINRYGDTAIHVGARTKDLAVVSHLIDRMDSSGSFQLLRSQNNKGDSALHEALRYRHPHVAKLLIKKDPYICLLANKSSESPLFLAVTKGYTDVVFHLLNSFQSAACECPNGWKRQVLHASSSAASDGLEGFEAQVLNSSPLLAYDGPKGWTALHAAVWETKGLVGSYMTEKLLKVKPELGRVADIYGRTPLHYAVDMCNALIVDLLLKHDASLAYIQDRDGWSPLHVAAHLWSWSQSYDNETMIENIIQYCPDLVYLLDNRGNNVLHILMERVKIDGWDELFPIYLFRKFVEFEGLLNQPNNDGNTPLHLACLHGKVYIVKILVENHAARIDKRSRNNNNLTAYEIVASRVYKSKRKKDITRSRQKWIHVLEKLSPVVPSPPQLWIESLNLDFGKVYEDEDEEYEDATVKWEAEEKETQKKLTKTHMLVATLIATVAFAAAFQMPGGYESSDQNKGMAVLAGEAAFGAFVISDVIALSCSILTLLLYFIAEVVFHDESQSNRMARANIILISMILITVAIVAMLSAFMFVKPDEEKKIEIARPSTSKMWRIAPSSSQHL